MCFPYELTQIVQNVGVWSFVRETGGELLWGLKVPNPHFHSGGQLSLESIDLALEKHYLLLIRVDAFFEPVGHASSGCVLLLLGIDSEVLETIADFFCRAAAFVKVSDVVGYSHIFLTFFDCIRGRVCRCRVCSLVPSL